MDGFDTLTAVSAHDRRKMEDTKSIKQMKRFKRSMVGMLLLVGLEMTVCSPGHGAGADSSLVVTDVTPVRFCAVWGTQEPATGWVSVFLDSEGTKPWAGAVIKPESPDHPPAEGIGVMKVCVAGLQPDTEYFFRTQTTPKKNSAVYESPMTRVKTEKAGVIVRNDVLVQKVDVGQTGSALGMLVIASIESASYPITGWVGDGVPDGWAAVDTNNFYSGQTHVNLELRGGEALKLKVFGGSLGSLETEETIPAERGGMQQLSRAVSLTASGGTQSGGSATGASGSGGGCFVATMME